MRLLRRLSLAALPFLALASFADGPAASAPVASGGGFAYACGPTLKPPHPREKFGPRYVYKSDPAVVGKVTLANLGRIKVMSYNMLNLLESPGKYVTIDGKKVFQYGKIEKPKFQLDGILRNINAEKPDILVGIEIESLDAMARVFSDEYFKVLVPGNDERGINIGFLIRKDLAVDLEIQSHRAIQHVYEGRSVKLFSRDYPMLSVRDAGAAEDSPPAFMVGGVHLKSQRGSDFGDVGSLLKRTAQVEGMVGIVAEYRRLYGDDVMILSAGDFNHDIATGPEFAPLKNSGQRDAFDVVGIPAGVERGTQSFFPSVGAPAIYNQLDAIFVTPGAARRVVDARVVAELGPDGKPLPRPKTYEEREARASDHLPVVVTLAVGKK